MVIIALSLLSGVLGRMGGAHGYETKWRDLGCPACFILAWIIHFGFVASFWWVYLLTFVLMFGAFTTYWDWLFKGEDNLWFSGLVVGISAMPLVIIDHGVWVLLLIRCMIIMVAWGLLNKFLPHKILCWNRDVVEEFSRYTISL